VIWYYTFGVHCKNKFARSHTHLFHFVKDPKNFTFNTEKIRVPSARQLVYGDSRAHSAGRLPDDTWILRPQDAPDAFDPSEDTWYVPRVCGTFKERAGWHGCQMPEQLLGRIIRACSNPGETVLDPFGGSGTTLVVAKKLDRHFIGFELSKSYARQIEARLDRANSGDALLGSEEPKVSAPATVPRVRRQKNNPPPQPAVHIADDSGPVEFNKGVIEAFFAVRKGFPIDRVIADPELNHEFVEKCASLGLPGKPMTWNHRLMNMRKAGHLKGLVNSKRTAFPMEEKTFYRYKFACEIAIQRFEEDNEVSLDHVLCDPDMASAFDRYVLTMLPDQPTSLMIRWFALRIRKAASSISQNASKLADLVVKPNDGANPFSLNVSKVLESPGIYWLQDEKSHLYVGETDNMRERLEFQFGHNNFDFWKTARDKLMLRIRYADFPLSALPKHQSRWISKWQPLKNYARLATPA
jgi:hypothetical protein